MTDTLVRPDHLIPAELARDVVDPKAHTDEARFHGALTWLRANEPLGWCQLEGFDPFWIVTKHADILEISRQNALFPSGERQTVLTTKAMADAVLERTGSPHLVRSLVQMDAPDHPKYRALTVPWFAPANVKKREAAVREIARESVDRMASMGGRCDFVSEVALHYPLRVIMNILGVPREDEPRMLKLTQELFGAQDPDLNRTGATPFDDESAMAAMQATLADFFMYFDAVTQDRRANPADDVATVIANALIDGEPIAPFEAVGYYVIVATAATTPPAAPPRARCGRWPTTPPSSPGQDRPLADPRAGGRGGPLDHAGQALHALGDRGLRAPRSHHPQGRLAVPRLPVRQPGRGGVRGPVHLPRRPLAQQAPGLRLRGAPVPRPAPRQAGDAHPV
jgi:hypothetical protein